MAVAAGGPAPAQSSAAHETCSQCSTLDGASSIPQTPVASCDAGMAMVPMVLERRNGTFLFPYSYSFALCDLLSTTEFYHIVDQLNATIKETAPRIGCVMDVLMNAPITSRFARASVLKQV
eukprot:gene20104-26822_t